VLASSIVGRARQEPAVLVFSLALGAICLDYILIPALNTVAPAVSCGMLLLFLLRSRPSAPVQPPPVEAVAGWRLLLFFSLHLAAVGIFWLSRNVTEPASTRDLLPNFGVSAAKYLVLAPTIVLLPLAGWRRFLRLYRAEWVAAAIALFTLFPYRIVEAVWPWYSQALGHVVYALAHPFVSGLQYVSLPSPMLAGPELDVTILFWCNGLEGIKLFQIVFVLMLVVDWTAINRRRALLGYFGGLAMILVANVLRIALLVIAGNRFPQIAVQHHVTAGWIFFALVLVVYILAAYNWLVTPPGDRTAGNAASLIQPGFRSASQ